jgi:hypothetical protein
MEVRLLPEKEAQLAPIAAQRGMKIDELPGAPRHAVFETWDIR